MKITLITLLMSLITITNWAQCNLDSTFYTNINPNNTLDISFGVNDSSNTCSFYWNFGDNSSSTLAMPNHTYNQAGTYTVCLTMGACNTTCYDTICQTITIIGNPNPCNISASFNAVMSNNDSLTYTFNVLDSTQACDIIWNFGDGTSGQADFANHTYAQPGTYSVCSYLINCTNGCADSICQTVTVANGSNPCNISANYQWYQLYDSLNGSWLNTVYVVNLSTLGSNVNYFWDFGDNSTSNAMFPTHVYSNVGTYTICLTISDNQGCTSTYCDSIYVQTKASGFTLSVISQDAVGIEETETIALGKIYPNPTSDNASISIRSIEHSDITINILDLSGKIISQELNSLSFGENTIQLNTQSLSNGMYIISLTNEEGVNTNLRLIKK